MTAHQCQAQRFAAPGNVWHTTTEVNFGATTTQVDSIGELVIVDSAEYRTFYSSGTPRYLVREDTLQQKVYIYHNNAEWLKYDFSLNQGDTFENFAIVGPVDTIQLMDGSYRKRLFLTGMYPVYWIEGIGSLHGPDDFIAIGTIDVWHNLLCFRDSAGQKYQHPTIDGCFVSTVGSSAISNSKPFSLFPNPARDHVTLKIHLPSSTILIRVTDLHGKMIFAEHYIATGDQTLPLDNYPSGYYIISLTSDELNYRIPLIVSK